jgi:hypothetical protein
MYKYVLFLFLYLKNKGGPSTIYEDEREKYKKIFKNMITGIFTIDGAWYCSFLFVKRITTLSR